MTGLTAWELVWLVCGLGDLVIFASVIATLVVTAAVAVQFLV